MGVNIWFGIHCIWHGNRESKLKLTGEMEKSIRGSQMHKLSRFHLKGLIG